MKIVRFFVPYTILEFRRIDCTYFLGKYLNHSDKIYHAAIDSANTELTPKMQLLKQLDPSRLLAIQYQVHLCRIVKLWGNHKELPLIRRSEKYDRRYF